MQEVVEARPTTLNPFVSIWVAPRGTIRQIVDTNPNQYVIVLAVISGIYQALDRAQERAMGDRTTFLGIILLALVGGPIGGLISLYLGGALVRWTGSLFGGTAQSGEVRAALAWSSLPDAVLLLILVPIIAMYGHTWFTSTTIETVPVWLFLMLAGPGLVLVIWKAFLTVKCVAEVHRFSAWRSLVSLVVGFLILLIPVLCVLGPLILSN